MKPDELDELFSERNLDEEDLLYSRLSKIKPSQIGTDAKNLLSSHLKASPKSDQNLKFATHLLGTKDVRKTGHLAMSGRVPGLRK